MAPDAKKACIQEFITTFDLEGREGDIISSYSDGMRQKVAFISALSPYWSSSCGVRLYRGGCT